MSSERVPRLPLAATYHDGQLVDVEIGPRREVVLSIRLDPVWNAGSDRVQRLHFSAIENFDEVRAFFVRAPEPDSHRRSLSEVIGIVQPERGVVGVDLSPLGYVEVRTRNVREL